MKAPPMRSLGVSEVSDPGQVRSDDSEWSFSMPEVEPGNGLLGRVDARNLGAVLFGFVFVLILVPPVRVFPMDDDWVYAQSVKDLLAWTYKPHESSMALALGHIAWGALFSSIFGYNFTTLSIATLTMSAAGLVLFYLLLRHLNVGPTQALLGTILLGCNPIYVYLSYSFMTDMTFFTYMLAACLCYVRGAQRYGQYWFWLGGVATALAYLTRQIGILVLPAALIYLWWSHRWSWQTAFAISAIPVAAIVSYAAWESAQPATIVSVFLNSTKTFALSHPVEWAIVKLQSIPVSLATPGLCLLPLLWLPRRPILAAPLLVYFVVFEVICFRELGTMFPALGNVVGDAGFTTAYIATSPLWNVWVWVALGLVGVAIFALYAAACIEWVRDWLKAHKQQGWRLRTDDPTLILYALGLLLVVPTFVLTQSNFDRYLLPFMPMLMLPSLRRIGIQNTPSSHPSNRWRWLLIVPLALFSIIGMRDYLAHASARWQGAEQLVAQGASYNQVDAGYEWIGYQLNEDGLRYIRQTGDMTYVALPALAVLHTQYVVSYRPLDNYTQIGSLPYQSWLEGGRTRHVFLLKRN